MHNRRWYQYTFFLKLFHQIVELASYLDVVMTTDDVERVYRVGKKGKNGARTIVAQLANYEVHKLLKHIPYMDLRKLFSCTFSQLVSFSVWR